MTRIVIVGAGVSGLSTGIKLLELGYKVTIVTQETTPNTTSDIAAAIWMPYKVEPVTKTMEWAVISLHKFKELIEKEPKAGIQFKTHTELHSAPTAKPEWMNYLEALPIPDYVPACYKTNSFTVKIPVIDTTKYMPYLHHQFIQKGGIIINDTITSLLQLAKKYSVVINCTGLAAKELTGDQSVYPIRGHVLSIEKLPGFSDSMVRPDNLAHIITRSDDCLIGGTADEGDWDTEPSIPDKNSILAKVKEIYPDLGTVKVLREKVGLRPGRTAVCLQLQTVDDEHVIIHNYGHGGAGYTVSWGCAEEVATLTCAFLNTLAKEATENLSSKSDQQTDRTYSLYRDIRSSL